MRLKMILRGAPPCLDLLFAVGTRLLAAKRLSEVGKMLVVVVPVLNRVYVVVAQVRVMHVMVQRGYLLLRQNIRWHVLKFYEGGDSVVRV